jgi:hypothetical protein
MTLLVCTDTSLPAEEMVRLTEPWKGRFEAIYLLCRTDVVLAGPELRVLRGKKPF